MHPPHRARLPVGSFRTRTETGRSNKEPQSGYKRDPKRTTPLGRNPLSRIAIKDFPCLRKENGPTRAVAVHFGSTKFFFGFWNR